MLGEKVVNSLPNRELTHNIVDSLEDNERIDRAEVELTSNGQAYADGQWKEDMVEAFWISIDGTAHVLQFSQGEWIHRGTFEPSDDVGNHKATFDLIDY